MLLRAIFTPVYTFLVIIFNALTQNQHLLLYNAVIQGVKVLCFRGLIGNCGTVTVVFDWLFQTLPLVLSVLWQSLFTHEYNSLKIQLE